MTKQFPVCVPNIDKSTALQEFRHTNFVIVLDNLIETSKGPFMPYPDGCNYVSHSKEEHIKHFDGIQFETNQQQTNFLELKFFH